MNHLTEFFLFVVVLVTQAFFPVFLCSNFIKTIKHQAKNGYGRMFFEQKKPVPFLKQWRSEFS